MLKKSSSYGTRNDDSIPLIKLKRNFFKNTFFPSVISEWNKLDPIIGNVGSSCIFKSNIRKSIRPTTWSFFDCYNHKGVRLTTPLRLGLSYLHEYKFNHNFQNYINPLCSCGVDIESTSHFILHCPREEWIVFNRSTIVWKFIIWFERNYRILNPSIDYIISTEKFKEPLL